MHADKVLLAADPTRDVRNLHRIAGVVRGGYIMTGKRSIAFWRGWRPERGI